MYLRKETKVINIGNVKIGGGNKIAIQSMTNTKTSDVLATVKQIKELEAAGCEIIRVAVPDMEAAKAIDKIKKQINIPLVVDIHFDYRLALESIKRGCDKVRINPGNIGSKERVKEVVKACKAKNIPIRIGVNSGSCEKKILKKYGAPTAEALVESAMYHVEILEELDFYDIVISIKSSDVLTAVKAYELMAKKRNYPLHLGVTEAGTLIGGTVKSSVGLALMLDKGIGDTIRVSLTDKPIHEVDVAKKILQSIGLGEPSIEIVSCPTCGRTSIDLISIAKQVEEKISTLKTKKNIKVAVMGCIVNGPGEAREADFGLAGGKGEGLVFKKGEILRKVDESKLVEELFKEVKQDVDNQ